MERWQALKRLASFIATTNATPKITGDIKAMITPLRTSALWAIKLSATTQIDAWRREIFDCVITLRWITITQFQNPKFRCFLLDQDIKRYCNYLIKQVAKKEHRASTLSDENLTDHPAQFILKHSGILTQPLISPVSQAINELLTDLVRTLNWETLSYKAARNPWQHFFNDTLARHHQMITTRFNLLLGLHAKSSFLSSEHNAAHTWIDALSTHMQHPLNNPKLLCFSASEKQRKTALWRFIIGAMVLAAITEYLLSIPLTSGVTLPLLYVMMSALYQLLVPCVASLITLIGCVSCTTLAVQAYRYRTEQRTTDNVILPLLNTQATAKKLQPSSTTESTSLLPPLGTPPGGGNAEIASESATLIPFPTPSTTASTPQALGPASSL